MTNATYKFVLANAKDLSPLGELTQARGRQFSVIHNRPGSGGFSIPMDNELAQSIWPLQSALRVFRTGSTGQQEVWSGYCATIDEDVSNNRMTCNFVGWQERLNKRVLRRQKIYSAQDDGAIIQDLLAEANIDPPPWGSDFTFPAGSVPNTPTWLQWGGFLPDEGIGGATAYTTQTRNYTLQQFASVGQSIQQLTEIENGCDLFIDPTTRALYVQRRRRRIKNDVVFGFQWGPNNIQQLNRQIDSSTVVNWMLATGGGGLQGGESQDATSQGLYGPIEEVANLSDVAGANATSILLAYSGAEVVVRSNPRQIFNLVPFSWTSESAVPEPFVDYRVGDQVKLVAKHAARLNVNTGVRVFGMNVSIDEEGNERLGALSLSPGS